MEVREGFMEEVMLEQSCRINVRVRAFQAEGTGWTSVFLGGTECSVSEKQWGLDRMPRTQVPAKLPGLSPMVSELALLPLPALDTSYWLWGLGQP